MEVRTSTGRPLTPLEEDCLSLLKLQGWSLFLSMLIEQSGWSETTLVRNEANRAYLLVSSHVYPEQDELVALATALDHKSYDRVIYAQVAELSETGKDLFVASDIEVWSHNAVRSRLDSMRRARGTTSPRVPERLWIRQIRLRQHRGFDLRVVSFPEIGPVVFAGANGTGKSTILAAAATMLSWLPARIRSPHARGQSMQDSDIRGTAPLANLTIEVESSFTGTTKWSIERARSGAVEKANSVLNGVSALAIDIRRKLEKDRRTSLPLIVLYAANRSATSKTDASVIREAVAQQFGAYEDLQGVECRDLCGFVTWFRKQEDLENEVRIKEPTHRDAGLDAVRRAIRSVISDYDALSFRREREELVLEKRGVGELAFGQLSDGEQIFLSLVGDIARRLVQLNPDLEDPLTGGGVVLVDEVELHLHPAWQRIIVNRLTETFPNIQWIFTTHSPQVISDVPTANLFLLEAQDGAINVQTGGGFGWDSNTILKDLMGVSERPVAFKERLDEVGALLSAEQVERARLKLEGLEQILGPLDSEVVRLKSILRFLED